MKIIIHSMSELYELAAAIYGAKAPERVVGLPAALAAPFVPEPAVSAREEAPQDEPETEGGAAPPAAERATDRAGGVRKRSRRTKSADEPEEAPAQDKPVAEESSPRYTSEELAEHVLVCQEHAAGQSDSHVELLTNCKGFIELYGHAAFNELKAAVAPVEGSPSGKSLQQFDPSERRLMQACMASY